MGAERGIVLLESADGGLPADEGGPREGGGVSHPPPLAYPECDEGRCREDQDEGGGGPRGVSLVRAQEAL